MKVNDEETMKVRPMVPRLNLNSRHREETRGNKWEGDQIEVKREDKNMYHERFINLIRERVT